ncbi:MAG: flavin reductase family protein [Bacteroidia bacterium]|nr:flavin reductase family protein [Bacteroidia bacterium]
MEFIQILPKEVSVPKLHSYLLGIVGPRPIAFASTVDENGNPNLAPFSFFNVFSANPPILVFAPNRSGRTLKDKDTYWNALATKEVVINVVNYDIVEQASLASSEYPKGINEFEKAGLTAIPSQFVKPFRVAESPAQLECKVRDILSMGDGGGAGHLIICEVICVHLSTSVLDEQQRIDPRKIDLVARMGGNWYCRANFDALFEIAKPMEKLGIGIDVLPEPIRKSPILSGSELAKIGNLEFFPTEGDLKNAQQNYQTVLQTNNQTEIHKFAQKLIQQNQIIEAFSLLLCSLHS